MKRKRKINGPFVAVPIAVLDAPAWRAMDHIARLLWIALRRRLRNDGLNNGKIYLSCRNAAEIIGGNKDTIARRYAELEHYGFLRKTTEGFLGVDGRGIAPHYRFTDLAHGTHPATRDYEKWDGSIFENPPRKSGWKKHNPVLRGRTPRIARSDIRKTPNGGSVCIAPSDIGEAPRCIAPSAISRLPLPRAGEEEGKGNGQQGSLTVRAPAQAGGAGSSPAPVAIRPYRHSREGLMECVLSVVNGLLDDNRRDGPRYQDIAPRIGGRPSQMPKEMTYRINPASRK
jgi:hypothetical protein